MAATTISPGEVAACICDLSTDGAHTRCNIDCIIVVVEVLDRDGSPGSTNRPLERYLVSCSIGSKTDINRPPSKRRIRTKCKCVDTIAALIDYRATGCGSGLPATKVLSPPKDISKVAEPDPAAK